MPPVMPRRTLTGGYEPASASAGASAAAYKPVQEYWKKRNAPEFRIDEVTRGDVVAIVNATGKIKPVIPVDRVRAATERLHSTSAISEPPN